MSRTFYLVGPVLLLCLATPLAIFAAFTTFLAFTTLFIRVTLVYLELGVALLHSWLFADKTPKPLPGIKAYPPSPTSSLHSHSRKRLGHINSLGANNDTSSEHRLPTKSESFASLVGSAGANRDYEGVGGWREDDEREDAVWLGLNSRLELPAAGPDRQRRHRRSLSNQSQRATSTTPEAFRMSPVASRNRTPPAVETPDHGDGYFHMKPTTSRAAPMSPEEASAKLRMDERRASLGSGSSSASSGSTLRLATT